MTLAGVIAAVTTCGLLPAVVVAMRRLNVIDVPSTRSSHSDPTVRGGGIAVVVGMLCGLAAGSLRSLEVNWTVVWVVVCFAVLGWIDDLRGVGVVPRLAGQFGLGLLLAIYTVGSELGSLPTEVLAIVVAAIWMVSYTNAFNFMDGINGISALSAALAGAWYAYIGASYHLPEIGILGAVTAGSALAFAPWNLPAAKLFLGDVGSYALGAAIAAMSLGAVIRGSPLLVALAPLLIYLVDTGTTLVRRILAGRPWREAHREHIYQRLADQLQSHARAAGLVLMASTLCAVAVLVSDNPLIAGASLLVIAGVYVALPTLLNQASRAQ